MLVLVRRISYAIYSPPPSSAASPATRNNESDSFFAFEISSLIGLPQSNVSLLRVDVTRRAHGDKSYKIASCSASLRAAVMKIQFLCWNATVADRTAPPVVVRPQMSPRAAEEGGGRENGRMRAKLLNGNLAASIMRSRRWSDTDIGEPGKSS